jgi:DNA-binding NtrC family response regulator
LLARAVHDWSARAAQPFVEVDCGSLPETLLESELFGHVKGAFTGANQDKLGLFAVADRGTLFLDEVQNTSAALQAKLLRFIASGEFRPVGSTRQSRADVRVVAATNQELSSLVDAGHFRADLFFRLNAFTLHVPPLARRREDVLALAHRFLTDFAARSGRLPPRLSPQTAQALLAREWKGNVRELKGVIQRAFILAGDAAWLDISSLDELPALAPGSPADDAADFHALVAAFEKALLSDALQRAGGVQKEAARLLRLNPVTFGRKVHEHGLATRRTARPESAESPDSAQPSLRPLES